MKYLFLVLVLGFSAGCVKRDTKPQRPLQYSGWLELTDEYRLDGATHQLRRGANFREPVNSGPSVLVNYVKLNGEELLVDPNFQSYAYFEAPGITQFANPANWEVGGSSSIPSFSFSATKAFPHFSGTLPSTVKLSEGLSLNIPASMFTNTEYIGLYFQWGAGGGAYEPGSTLSIAPNEIPSTLKVGDTARIVLTALNSDFITVDGKNFEFLKVSHTSNLVTIQ
jgi:hypothetical protein